MKTLLSALCLWLSVTTGFAQPNLVDFDASCVQLEHAWNVITDEVRRTNYVEVLARAYFESGIFPRHSDGRKATLPEIEKYLKEASSYNPEHFVLQAVRGLKNELDEKKCPYEDLGFLW